MLCKLLGTYVLEINPHNCLFTTADTKTQLAHIHNLGVGDNVPITFALETKVKASKMGLINDLNGIDISQTHLYIKISCSSYIN